MTAVLDIENLQVTYSNGLRALDIERLHCERGTNTLIVGSNGAGKTSLLRAVTGFLPGEKVRVTADQLTVLGRRAATWYPHEAIRSGAVLVPDRHKVFTTLTVDENLALARQARRDGPFRPDELYELFPVLQQRGRQLAGLLSGGERQMLALSRALLAQPELLVIDELSMGLSPGVYQEIFHTLTQLQQRHGLTVILVEQGLGVGLDAADRVHLLREGSVVFSDASDRVLSSPRFNDLYFGAKHD